MATATPTPPSWDPAEMPPEPVHRFTPAEYRELTRLGILTEDDDQELLEGWIIPKMSKNPPHEVAIGLANRLFLRLLPDGWDVRIQSAIATADSEPEPDLAVVRGTARDYRERHPGPADIALVIEVADSSLPRDRGLKARVYARAGLPVYWIVNLIDRTVEIHTEPAADAPRPAYGRVATVGPDGTIPLVLDGLEVARIAARDLLP